MTRVPVIEILESRVKRPNFVAFIALFLWGFYIAITHHNLVKKLIGMYLVQTSVLLFLVTFSAKQEATVPILCPDRRQDRGASIRKPIATRIDVDGNRSPGGDAGSRSGIGRGHLSKIWQPRRRRDTEET